MKRAQFILLLSIIAATMLAAQLGAPAQEAFIRPRESTAFSDKSDDIQKLRQDLHQLREEITIYKQQVNLPIIREEIKKMVKVPLMTHRILLRNGTIVNGSILSENLNQLVLQTQIGEITIARSQVSSIEEIDLGNPILSLHGAIEEKTFPNRKEYTGKIYNIGARRADFARILFHLYNDQTEKIAVDSAFVIGSEIFYLSGIYSMSAIMPGETASFHCIVPISGQNVSYYTTEIRFEHFE
ncbi:MAG TPA: hypothetical protein ENN84_07775 [Candidatus Marinimicrobia bacterium]|nr:hypothetical protein [Candidatus Neomarinimicrobiota bacterium]